MNPVTDTVLPEGQCEEIKYEENHEIKYEENHEINVRRGPDQCEERSRSM